MNNKIKFLVLFFCFYQNLHPSTTQISLDNPALVYTFNWPDTFNQPQYQMCVKPGNFTTALSDFYIYLISENIPNSPEDGGGWYWQDDYPIAINRSHFYLTQAQCMGYNSGICLNSSLQLFRSNIVTAQKNPAYNSSNSLLVSVSDMFFSYRSHVREWYYLMYFFDQNNNDPTNQSIHYGANTESNIYAHLLNGNSDTSGGYADLYPATNSLYSLQASQWGQGLQGDVIMGGNMGIFYNFNQNNGLLVNPDGSFNGITDKNIIRTPPPSSSYSYTGYVEYYSNKTEQLTSYFNQNQAAFTNYLNQLYVPGNCVATTNNLLNLLNDTTCPNMVLHQSTSSSLSSLVLPGMYQGEYPSQFFANVIIPQTSTTLSTVFPASFPLSNYVLSNSSSSVSIANGYFLYFPLLMVDPGNPYYPEGWNYANSSNDGSSASNYEVDKALMSNFYVQLSQTQNIAPLGA